MWPCVAMCSSECLVYQRGVEHNWWCIVQQNTVERCVASVPSIHSSEKNEINKQTVPLACPKTLKNTCKSTHFLFQTTLFLQKSLVVSTQHVKYSFAISCYITIRCRMDITIRCCMDVLELAYIAWDRLSESSGEPVLGYVIHISLIRVSLWCLLSNHNKVHCKYWTTADSKSVLKFYFYISS